MGKRFLNDKTKDVFLGEDVGERCKNVLNTYLPYQKILVITTKKFKNENENYYNNFIKKLKVPIKEYTFLGKVNANKSNTTKLLSEISEDIAGVVVLSSGAIIDLVKIVSFIKEIPYILVPTKNFKPQHLTKLAKMKADRIIKFYRVNAPLAVLLDETILTKKRTSVLFTFTNMISVSTQLLDEFLVGICRDNTLFTKHFTYLKSILQSTLQMENKLYNYDKVATKKLLNNALKAGLILQSYNLKNIDAGKLSAAAIVQLDKTHKIPHCYYQVVAGLFLVNLYESFIVNLKANNFFLSNIRNRLKIGEQIFNSRQLKKNIIKNLNESNELKLHSYRLKEYQTEILNEIKEIRLILTHAYTILKRMHLSLSYYVEKNLDIEVVKKAICLAPDLTSTNNFLKIMCNFGVLDYNF